jgi:hypothetical protein
MKVNTTLFDFETVLTTLTYSEIYSFLEKLLDSNFNLEVLIDNCDDENEIKKFELQLEYVRLNIDTFIDAISEHELNIVRNVEIDYEEYQLCLN